MVNFLAKVLIFFLILTLGYYLLFLLPHRASSQAERQDYFNLVENRLAYVELIKLDPTDPNYPLVKTDLVAKIKQTTNQGLKSKNKDIASLMETQKDILDELFTTKTYEEGITILTSPKSVKMLTEETNLLIRLGGNLR